MFFRTNSFPRNPNSGGNPPNDINTKIIIILSINTILFICINNLYIFLLYIKRTPTSNRM